MKDGQVDRRNNKPPQSKGLDQESGLQNTNRDMGNHISGESYSSGQTPCNNFQAI